jgi:hypothetical protein
MAEVEMADDPEAPAPPAPTPKIVVEPTVVVPMAEPPDDATETMAEVVIADEVPVTVVKAEVTRVVEAGPVAVEDPAFDATAARV